MLKTLLLRDEHGITQL